MQFMTRPIPSRCTFCNFNVASVVSCIRIFLLYAIPGLMHLDHANAQQPDTLTKQTLREVVVTGNFPAYLKAIYMQRLSPGVVSILNLDLPGRFPDLNPAEALQRLPGVVVQRSEGEGRFIHIRGADPSFTTVQVNGEQIISPESKSRFLQFDLLPVDQLQSVEVYKTNLPDQDGDAIGGSVNLVTKKIGQGPAVWRGALASGLNPVAGLPNGQVQLAYTGRRLVFNGSIWQDHRATENLETVYGFRDFGQGNEVVINSLELRKSSVARRRVGLSGEYQRPLIGQSGHVFIRALYAGFLEDKLRQRLRYRPEKDAAASPHDTIYGAEIGRDLQHMQEKEQFVALQTGIEKVLRRWKLTAVAAYSYGLEAEPEGQSLEFVLSDVNLLPIKHSGRLPDYLITNGKSTEQYNEYQVDELELEDERSTDQNLTGKLNVRYQIRPETDFVQIGVKARTRNKQTNSSEQVYEGYFGANQLLLLPLLASNTQLRLPSQSYDFGRQMDWEKTRQTIRSQSNNFVLNELETALESVAGNFEVQENTVAGYAMIQLERGRWQWIAGARLENTLYRYTADEVIIDSAVFITPGSRKFSGQYNYLLPTIAIRYNGNNDIQWRAVIGSSYARPGFDQIAPFELFNQMDAVVLAGNPDLVPTYAWNVDLTMEKKLKHGGAVSAALFGKRLKNFIFTEQSTELRQWKGQEITVLKTTPINGETAWLAGFELGWQQKMQMLPGAWSGLGVFANYSFTWSSANTEEEKDGAGEEEAGFQLPGQAPHSGNLAIWYDYKKWSGRLALHLQSDFLLQIAEPEDAALQQLYGGAAQLDCNAGYQINPHLTLFMEGMNLLNTPLRYFTGGIKQPSKLEYYGMWGRIGIKLVW